MTLQVEITIVIIHLYSCTNYCIFYTVVYTYTTVRKLVYETRNEDHNKMYVFKIGLS